MSRLVGLTTNPVLQGAALATIGTCLCIATPASLAVVLVPTLPWLAALLVLPTVLPFLRSFRVQIATGVLGAAVASAIALACAAGSPFLGPVALAAAVVGGVLGVAIASYARQLLAFVSVAGAGYRIFGPAAAAGSAASTAGTVPGAGALASNAAWLSLIAGITLMGLHVKDCCQAQRS